MTKTLLPLLCLLVMALSLSAQAPESFNYQAVVRDTMGNVLADQPVGICMSIRIDSAAGPIVYQETHTPMTNAFGLVDLQIGTGTRVAPNDTFSAIDWGMGPYFLEMKVDPTGGTNYNITGICQLLSVPYALYSTNAMMADTAKNEADGDPSNELQQLRISGDTLFISDGNYVLLPVFDLVQGRLDLGESPCDIIESGVPIKTLYGKTYQGGLIFHVDMTDGGCGGLVAAPMDQSAGMSWDDGSFTTTGATGTAVGTGHANTDSIVANQGMPTATDQYAAHICYTLTLGGFIDWFLPSRGELDLMWNNLADSDGNNFNSGPTDPNNLGGFEQAFYWSSTEDNFNFAWGQLFVIGLQLHVNKDGLNRVRAIRAF